MYSPSDPTVILVSPLPAVQQKKSFVEQRTERPPHRAHRVDTRSRAWGDVGLPRKTINNLLVYVRLGWTCRDPVKAQSVRAHHYTQQHITHMRKTHRRVACVYPAYLYVLTRILCVFHLCLFVYSTANTTLRYAMYKTENAVLRVRPG